MGPTCCCFLPVSCLFFFLRFLFDGPLIAPSSHSCPRVGRDAASGHRETRLTLPWAPGAATLPRQTGSRLLLTPGLDRRCRQEAQFPPPLAGPVILFEVPLGTSLNPRSYGKPRRYTCAIRCHYEFSPACSRLLPLIMHPLDVSPTPAAAAPRETVTACHGSSPSSGGCHPSRAR